MTDPDDRSDRRDGRDRLGSISHTPPHGAGANRVWDRGNGDLPGEQTRDDDRPAATDRRPGRSPTDE